MTMQNNHVKQIIEKYIFGNMCCETERWKQGMLI